VLGSNLLTSKSLFLSSNLSFRIIIRKFYNISNTFVRDIIAVGLQEIVQLNMFNVLKGKNKTTINEWE
jgi:hypothetical protein